MNKASDYACIVFIFVYSLGYSMGFGPASWVYGSEVGWRTDRRPPEVVLTTPIDLPHVSPCPRSKLFRLRRRYRLHRGGSGLAGWHCQPRVEDLLLLYGHQYSLRSGES